MKLKENYQKVEIDILLFIFLSLLGFTWFDHFLRFLSSLLSGGYINNPKECIALAAILLIIFLLFIKKFIKITVHNVSFIDIMLLSIGTIYFLLKLPFVENMFDTICYELHVQEFPFVDWVKTNQPFMDKSYLYALGDRVYYYFRILFGYRLSVLPNYLIYLISYFKIKEILKYFYTLNILHKYENIIINFIVPIMSIMCLLCEYFVSGMYLTKTDIFIVPIFLECFRLAFCKDELFINDYVYASLLIGFSVAIKINFIIILVILIFYVFLKNRKTLNIKMLFASIIPCVIILSIYIIHNYISVRNITYPYYNWIFKSPYAPLEKISWDDRWGPKTVFEKILWPIYCFVKPNRYSELPYCSGRLGLGYIIAIVSIIINLFFKKHKSNTLLFVFIINVLLWSITSGYSRYDIANDIFSGIIICITILELVNYVVLINKKIFRNMLILLTSLFCINVMYTQAIITYINLDWKANNNSLFVSELSSNKTKFFQDYTSNFKRLFNDRGNIVSNNNAEIEKILDKVKLWIDANNNMYYMMLKNDAKIYIENTMFPGEVTQKAREELYTYYGQDGIYAIGKSALGDEYAKQKYAELGLTIAETYIFEVDYLNVGDPLILYHLVPNKIPLK